MNDIKFHLIDTGLFKLDGGAMFGEVPKSIWNRSFPADENNLITLAKKALLVETNNRLILFDTGMGNKQSEKFLRYFHLHGDGDLIKSIQHSGFATEDVTDVFFTHLHFDHCGGAVQWKEGTVDTPELVFENATHWSNKQHWQWAKTPNAREKASFLAENLDPIADSGKLKFIEEHPNPFEGIFDLIYVDGHTEKQMIPVFDVSGSKFVFAADLLPTIGHIPMPYVMSYDVRPLLTLKEKADFFERCTRENINIILQHDATTDICTLKQTPKGPRLDQQWSWDEFFKK